MSTLSENAIRDIFSDGKPKQPVVQLIDMKPLQSADAAVKRVKGTISDGERFGVALFSGAAAAELKIYASLRLKQFTTNNLAGTKLCLVLEAEQVAENEEKIGAPVAWDSHEQDSTTPLKAAPPASNTPETVNAAPRVVPAGFGGASSSSPLSLGRPIPIDALNPYTNKWTIRVRVVNKSDLRTVTTSKGSTSVFSMDLCDESGEIRASCWREAAERFHALAEVGKVYLIARGQLKMANKKFSTLNNQYEMALGFDSHMQLCTDQDVTLPLVRYSFVPIADIANKATNAVVDVIGVASEIAAIVRLTTKAGKELTKRTLTLSDDSGAAIEVTLWAERAESFPDQGNPVVAFKGLRVTEWNTKSLGAIGGTAFELDPEREETPRLQEWWAGGGASNAQKLSVSTYAGATRDETSRTNLNEIVDEQLGAEPAYFNVRTWIARVAANNRAETPCWYAACVKCSKKALGDDTSGFSCEACGWSGPQPQHRYILSLAIQDSTGQRYVSAFNDQAAAIIGKSADELKAIKDTSFDAYEQVLNDAQWKPVVMRMRAKMETYNQQSRPKMHVLGTSNISFVSEGKALLADINLYNTAAAEA